ncbi:MAG: MTH1187 family thiamine-binding protein [Chitinispirillaceae bacterium]|nr:MTH1187 family thiamine-binding protein [Chitinispirillaceae bacterium]
MPIMEISVVPVGTKSPSVSAWIASCIDLLDRKKNCRYELTSMGTIVEAKYLKTLLRIAEEMHGSVFSRGVKRVVTTIKIDDRRDKMSSVESKVKSIRRHLEKRKRGKAYNNHSMIP